MIVCDKCRKQLIETEKSAKYKRLSKVRAGWMSMPEDEIILCDKCYKEFLKWLKRIDSNENS